MKVLGILVSIVLVSAGLWFGLGIQLPPDTRDLSADKIGNGIDERTDVDFVQLATTGQADPISPVEDVAAVIDTMEPAEPLDALPSSETPPVPVATAIPKRTAVPNGTDAVEPIAAPPVVLPPALNDSLAPVSAADVPIPGKVHVFWKPFNTKGSARGFAQSLTQRSDVPVSVVEERAIGGPQYRVAVPFDTEEQRNERIAQIEATTRFEIQ